ncbi:MAG: hypothetical protein BWY76_00796 [bacterium ADurb.Bin429]|nr:MAG: hypothetical protein BWY76_00796 [bacterium ADurb.Bin429]
MHPNLIRAVYHLASAWHSGLWSRGYRLLCRVYRYAHKHGIDVQRQTRASRRLYWRLVARYKDRL